jgi:diguanylate cyclase (GGDEF)-like protein
MTNKNEPGDPTARPRPSAEEAARLLALRSYCVLDTGREGRFDDLTALASSICETPVSLVSLVDSGRLFFKSEHGLGVREVPDGGTGFCRYAIRQRDIFEVPDTREDARFAQHPLVTSAPHVRFYAGAPLITPDDLALGTLCVIDFRPRKLDVRQTEALRILSRQVIAQLELNLQAMRDPLTGLYNRRPLEESLHRELLRARRGGSTVGLMAIDLDRFKQVNDTLGHDAGDAVLRTIARELMACVREEDIVCRAGGEEFVVILPGTGEYALRERAELVRRTIERESITTFAHPLRVTVSIGLALYPGHGATTGALMRAADAALYQAKGAGRNCIVMADMEGDQLTLWGAA